MLVKLDKDFMVDTKNILALEIQNEGISLVLEYGKNNDHRWHYNSKEGALKKFDEISSILEKSIHIKVDKNGAFLCSHCGAPNDGK